MKHETEIQFPLQVKRAIQHLRKCAGTGGGVFLFGSRARGEVHSGRDYDIGVMTSPQVSWEQFCLWRSEATDMAWPYKVDVVDLSRAPSEFADVIKLDMVTLSGESDGF